MLNIDVTDTEYLIWYKKNSKWNENHMIGIFTFYTKLNIM